MGYYASLPREEGRRDFFWSMTNSREKHIKILTLEVSQISVHWRSQAKSLWHRELCSMLCGSLGRRGVWGRWIHVHVWLSPFAIHLKLSQHCQPIGFTPIQNKKSLKFEKTTKACSKGSSEHSIGHPNGQWALHLPSMLSNPLAFSSNCN